MAFVVEDLPPDPTIKGATPATPPALTQGESAAGGFLIEDLPPVQAASPRLAREGMSPPAPEMGYAESLGRGAQQGITLGFGDEISGALAAGQSGTIPNLTPLDPLVRGVARLIMGDPEARKRFDDAIAEERLKNEESARTNPKMHLAGELGGAVAIPVPGSLAAQGVRGAAKTGAAFGAAYGAGTAEGGPVERIAPTVTGAAVGGVLGAATPYAIRGIVAAGAGIRAVGEAILGGPVQKMRAFAAPEDAARRLIQAKAAEDAAVGSRGLTPTEFQLAQMQGQPVVAGDMGGEAMQRLARFAWDNDAKAGALLKNVTQDRFEEQVPRVTAMIQRMFGGALDSLSMRETIQAAARKANKPAYERAYNDGAALWDEGFAQLMTAPAVQQAAKAALRTGANKSAADGFLPIKRPFDFAADGSVALARDADGNAVIPNLQFWDYVKRNLDDMIDVAKRKGEKSEAADVETLRRYLVSHLDNLVPSYKDARQGAAKFFGAEDALEAGAKFVGSNADIAGARRAIGKMVGPEKELFAQGFAEELIKQVGKIRDGRDVVISNLFQTKNSRDAIELALGPARAREVETYLRVEGVMNGLRSMLGGSQTSRNLAIGGAGALLGGYQGGNISDASLGGMIALGLKRGNQALNAKLAQHLAEMLTSTDARVVTQAISQAAANPQAYSAIRALSDMLAKQAAGGPAGVVAGQASAPANRGLAGVLPGVTTPKADDERQKRQ